MRANVDRFERSDPGEGGVITVAVKHREAVADRTGRDELAATRRRCSRLIDCRGFLELPVRVRQNSSRPSGPRRLCAASAALAWALLTCGCASTSTAQPAVAPGAAPQAPTTAAPIEIPAGRDLVEDRTFASEALGRTMRYRVILPDDYTRSLRRYPALYLLHGLTGNYRDWETRTDIFRYTRDLGLIIVMPDAGNSWYSNSQVEAAARFETYIASDLVEDVDRSYRTIATRHGRAIAGLSMGGYGALKFGLKYASRFVFAGSSSGAVAAADPSFAPRAGETFGRELQAILGPVDSPSRLENDLLALVAKADPATLPFLYLDCGTEDRLLESNRVFVAALQRKKIAYEYHEVPGGHTWDYWDRQVQTLLLALTQRWRVN
jgi:S-formylglutathione hydrolase FrmB